jgi:hypothetical protein
VLVVYRDNTYTKDSLLNIGQTYFVENIRCVDNQFYYKLKGFDTLFCYWDFNILSELRDKKLKHIGI